MMKQEDIICPYCKVKDYFSIGKYIKSCNLCLQIFEVKDNYGNIKEGTILE